MVQRTTSTGKKNSEVYWLGEQHKRLEKKKKKLSNSKCFLGNGQGPCGLELFVGIVDRHPQVSATSSHPRQAKLPFFAAEEGHDHLFQPWEYSDPPCPR